MVRSDGTRKRCALKWTNDNRPVPPLLLVREVEEFDRLRWERELVRRARLRNGGEGSSTGASSSSAPPALPPPEEYDASSFESSITPEDFVRDDDLKHTMAVVKLRSAREAAERAAQVNRDHDINEIFLHQGLKQDRAAREKKAAMVVDLVSDEE